MNGKRVTPVPRRANARSMRTTIQIRNVPESVKRILAEQAAGNGTSLSAHLRAVFEALAATPSEAEVQKGLERATPSGGRGPSAGSTRAARAERTDPSRALTTRYKGSASDIEAMLTAARQALPPGQDDFDVGVGLPNG